jgi:hypothetical protein
VFSSWQNQFTEGTVFFVAGKYIQQHLYFLDIKPKDFSPNYLAPLLRHVYAKLGMGERTLLGAFTRPILCCNFALRFCIICALARLHQMIKTEYNVL